MDNIFTKRLRRIVKYEDVYIKDYAMPRELRSGIGAYFEKCSCRRTRQLLGYKKLEDVSIG